MNPAITAALLAAQQSEAPSPVDRLTSAGAVSSEKAVAIVAESPTEQKQIDEAIRLGLVQRRADGHFFLNERAVAERNARIGYQLLLGTLVGLSILASASALLNFAGR